MPVNKLSYIVKIRVSSPDKKPFPVDMLRRDRLSPKTERDSNEMYTAVAHPEELADGTYIALQGYRPGLLPEIQTDAWKEAGWQVDNVECKHFNE